MTDEAPVTNGRLQRPADFTGKKIHDFRTVLIRHGLPGLMLAIVTALGLFLMLDVGKLLNDQWCLFLTAPEAYLIVALVILGVILGWSFRLNRQLTALQAAWIAYLLGVSIAEEWAFRLALPLLLDETGLTFSQSVLLSNLLFGAMHYFTLRWKLSWCVLTALGGIGLSRWFAESDNLLLIIGIHWLATFINTPRPPRPHQAPATS